MKIGVFGCSWSVQSYQKLPDGKETLGSHTFQQMFSDQGIECVNLSKLSGSNNDILNCLQKNNTASFDKILIFQTDPLRDIFDRKLINFKNIDSRLVSCCNINQISEILLSEFYHKLLPWSDRILLIGGLSKICKTVLPSSLSVLDRSWTESVNNDFLDCYYEWYGITEAIIDQYSIYLDWQDIDSMKFETKKQIYAKNKLWQDSDCFGWCHPGDGAYQIMFKQLCDKLCIG
jgi:hypothetical protein